MNKFRVLVISSCLLFIGVLYFSTHIVKRLNAYRGYKDEIAEVLNFENRLVDVGEYIEEYIPFYEPENDRLTQWEVLKKKSKKSYKSALNYGFGLVILVFSYILLNYFTSQNTENSIKMVYCGSRYTKSAQEVTRTTSEICDQEILCPLPVITTLAVQQLVNLTQEE